MTGCPARASAFNASETALSSRPRVIEINTLSSPYEPTSPSGSFTIGTSPLPSLPVDSAMSCSIHMPKLSISFERKKVSLSLPLSPSFPRAAPSISTGFSGVLTHGCSMDSTLEACSRRRPMSMPVRAAGTSPK